MSSALWLIPIPLVLVAVWGAILLAFRRLLLRLWREPVLRRPVLIIESDDWGPGPAEHVQALRRISEVLEARRDADGHPAVMTVGVMLGIPDTQAIRQSGYREYSRQTLLDAPFAPMREALMDGARRGVLALQLHGMEHLWPPAFMEAARHDPATHAWVEAGDGSNTEAIPPPLQSRWVDASVLPARPLEKALIDPAVEEEVATFRRCFGEQPEVVVPPTFVWNRTVEAAWARHDIRTLITPGRRFTSRDAEGQPAGVDRHVLNGERAARGMRCLVRDVYFEPARGHTAERVLDDVAQRFLLGRPALLETHRFNFTESAAVCAQSLKELDALLRKALSLWPEVRFVSSAKLARYINHEDEAWVNGGLAVRLTVWLRRVGGVSRLRKLAWMSGLVVPASLLRGVAERVASDELSRHSGIAT